MASMQQTVNIATQPPAPAWCNKVPEITLGFWVIKIMSTTVGETMADTLAVNVGLGTAITGAAMTILLCIALYGQMRSRRYVPWLYWLTVVLVSVVGTQITDALTDRLGISLYSSTSAFAIALGATFILWHRREGTLSIRAIDSVSREAFYWAAILCTFALGTAAGDLATEAIGLGFQWGVVVFGVLIAFVAFAFRRGFDAVLAFWVAYILTRPLGAALGDLLSQSKTYGGLGFGAMATSAMFLTIIVALVAMAQRRPSPAGAGSHK
jgi:uncharacterized membrane-anchored protein